MDVTKLVHVQVDGVDTKDYPDFVDAYICYAEWEDTGESLTDVELEELNSEHSDFVYDSVIAQLF